MNIKIKSGVFLREHVNASAKVDIWCIHGLGESSLSFREAFESDLKNDANIFALDFPGSGVTPWQNFSSTLEGFSTILINLIKEHHSDRPIYILGHSASGIIGTRACEELSDIITGFINVEGNLTKSDGFLSSFAKKHSSSEDYYRFCLNRVRGAMKDNVAFNRYYASLNFCHPDCLFTWAKETFAAAGETKAGEHFLKLPIKKVFLWGDTSLAQETQDFINTNNIPNTRFHGAGHWSMIDQPDAFYQEVNKFILD